MYIYLNEKQDFNGFLKIIGAQNQLPITLCLDIKSNKTLKARNATPTHTDFLPLISLLRFKSEQKVMRK